MNKLLWIFWIWWVITLSINLHRGLDNPIPSMICLLLSIWITVSSLNELDRENIKSVFEEHFEKIWIRRKIPPSETPKN